MRRSSYQGSAEFSPCGLHRHRLDRWWSDAPRALVCGANPSRAGADANDPTIFRLLDLLSWRPGIGGFTVVNADDFIATDPSDLVRWRDGLDLAALQAFRRANLDRIRVLSATAAIRIAAWGALVPPGLHQHRLLAALSGDGTHPVYAFGRTDAGAPKHPLARGHHRIPNDVELVVWREVARNAGAADERRAAAAEAAKALRDGFVHSKPIGEPQVAHMLFSNPERSVYFVIWPTLPGFFRLGNSFAHGLLPGWEYALDEVASEMIPDLEALAERGVRPIEATDTNGAAA